MAIKRTTASGRPPSGCCFTFLRRLFFYVEQKNGHHYDQCDYEVSLLFLLFCFVLFFFGFLPSIPRASLQELPAFTEFCLLGFSLLLLPSGWIK